MGDHNEEYEPEDLDNLIDTIKELATDSSKSRSKKDRKEQRHIFRDILRGVDEGDPPSEKIKFGQETLLLDYWYKKTQYDWFSKVLGSGTNHHLSTNYMLREIFELGDPLPSFDINAGSRLTKTQRVRYLKITNKIFNISSHSMQHIPLHSRPGPR